MKLPGGLPFAKPQTPPPPVLTVEEAEGLRKQLAEARLQAELYKLIVERYHKFIEDSESKSIAELRQLVRPLDAAVTELKISIQDQFHPYLYQDHFLKGVEAGLNLVFAWKSVSMPVSFWVGFSDMARLHAADDIDRAILLCSLMRALGSDNARVLIGKNKSAWVTFTFADKQYVVDIARRAMNAFNPKEDSLKQFMFSILYSFNDRDYQDFSEG
ncbi:Uncharacterised protein [uncultured archaeon]|nr:Uncharacterised protein [uncultured archaeon]